jgi:hypothetical protein
MKLKLCSQQRKFAELELARSRDRIASRVAPDSAGQLQA